MAMRNGWICGIQGPNVFFWHWIDRECDTLTSVAIQYASDVRFVSDDCVLICLEHGLGAKVGFKFFFQS